MLRSWLVIVGVAVGGVLLLYIIMGKQVAAADARAEMHADSAEFYRGRYDQARAEATRARSEFQALKKDTVTLTRWREIRVSVPSPVDTAAILAAFPGLVEASDSLARWCTSTIAACEAALAADSVATDLIERENGQLRASAEALEKKIKAMNTARTLRDILVGSGAFSLGYTVCEIKN